VRASEESTPNKVCLCLERAEEEMKKEEGRKEGRNDIQLNIYRRWIRPGKTDTGLSIERTGPGTGVSASAD
jgi:hypothetical protein